MKCEISRPTLLVGVAITALVSFATPATAQSKDASDSNEEQPVSGNEIVVTARFREETVDDLGQTINVLTSDDLEDRGVATFDDIVRATPALDNVARGPGRNLPYIRGVSQSNVNSDLLGQANTVAQFFDEVPLGSLQNSLSEVPIQDISRVEVLKGPQPTFFGEGSMGGSIRFFSQNPSLTSIEGRTRAQVSTTRGGDLSYAIDGSLSVPLAEDVAGLRVTGFYEDRDGFIDNGADGREDINTYENIGFSGVLLVEPSSNFTWRLSGFYQDQEIGGEQATTGDPDDLTVLVPGPDARTDRSFLISNKLSLDLGPVTIESVTGYFDRKVRRDFFDATQSFVLQNTFFLPGAEAFTTTVNADQNFTQELRIITDFDGPINFVGGVYYADTETEAISLAVSEAFVPIAGSDFYFEGRAASNGEQLSGFGEVQISLLDDRLRLAAGARYFDQQFVIPVGDGIGGIQFPFDLTGTGLPPTLFIFNSAALSGAEELLIEVSEFLPKVQVEFEANPDLLLFASFSEGARNGYFNSPAVTALNGLPFDEFGLYGPDKVQNYEIGFKSTLANGALQLNGAGFYIDFTDYQTALNFGGTGLTLNTGDARIIGVEGALNWSLSDNFSFYANGSYVDAEFTEDIPLAFAPGGAVTGTAPEGTELPQTADLQFSTGLEGRFPVNAAGDLELVGRVDYSHTAARSNTLTPVEALAVDVGALDLVNLRIGVERDTWSIFAFANNLFDDVERTVDQDATLNFSFINQPRTFGLVFRGSF